MTKLDKKQKWKEHYVNVYLRNKTKIVEPPKYFLLLLNSLKL